MHDVRVLELHFITVSVFVTIICSDSKCILMMLEREDPDIEIEISFGKHILTLMRISRVLDCFLQHTNNDTGIKSVIRVDENQGMKKTIK